MGHVDHGKTSLLDYIRKTRVARRGRRHHAAHRRLPRRNAPRHGHLPRHAGPRGLHGDARPRRQGTDLVILVVAADDGVMPQTKEAIHHAKAANVPLIVAVNKIDKPEANPERVKQELVPRAWCPKSTAATRPSSRCRPRPARASTSCSNRLLLQAEVLELTGAEGHAGQGPRHRSPPRQGQGPGGDDPGAVRHAASAATCCWPARCSAACAPCSTRTASRSTPPARRFRSRSRACPTCRPPATRHGPGRRAQGARDRAVPPGQVPRRQAGQAAGRQAGEHVRADGRGRGEDAAADRQGRRAGFAGSAGACAAEAVDRRGQGQHHPCGVGGISESDVNLASASKAVIIGFNTRADAARASWPRASASISATTTSSTTRSTR
jgi:translation initiation factor IF-2